MSMWSLFPCKTFTDAEAYKEPDNRAAKMFAGILCGREDGVGG